MSIPYEKRQEKWIKRHNVKIGDIVTVFRKYDPKTCGEWTWKYVWVDKMCDFIGKSAMVVDIHNESI